jgi:hypothetical protein
MVRSVGYLQPAYQGSVVGLKWRSWTWEDFLVRSVGYMFKSSHFIWVYLCKSVILCLWLIWHTKELNLFIFFLCLQLIWLTASFTSNYSPSYSVVDIVNLISLYYKFYLCIFLSFLFNLGGFHYPKNDSVFDTNEHLRVVRRIWSLTNIKVSNDQMCPAEATVFYELFSCVFW